MKILKFSILVPFLAIVIIDTYAWSAIVIRTPVAISPPPQRPAATLAIPATPETTRPTPLATASLPPQFVSNPFPSACKDQSGATDGFYSGSPLDTMVKDKPSAAEELMTKCCNEKDNRANPNSLVRELYGSQCTSVGYVPSDLSAGQTTWGEGLPPWKRIYNPTTSR